MTKLLHGWGVETGMQLNQNEFISLVDLGMAYRKAKADLFYSPRECREALSSFEAQLIRKIRAIKKSLDSGEAPALSGETWTLVPKTINDKEPDSNLISSDPQYLWDSICHQARKNNKKVQVEFRLMEKLPVDFHVFSSLWINKVGHKFEEKLTQSARANRLRRGKSEKLNPLSLGSMVPYLYAYCKWRDDAFLAMERALRQDKSVVAITADISSFYHKLDVRFMSSGDFIDRIGVELSAEERKLNKLFINALHRWAMKTPIKRGLPVGLTASSLIANVALFELDQLFEKEVVPLYYGRYVDDILLVMEDGKGFRNSIEVWDWLAARMDGALVWKDKSKKEELLYIRDYLGESEILFTNDKNKTFLLNGPSGQAVLKSIRKEVQSRTSEWRSLPNLPNQPDKLESELLFTIQRDGVSADSLRKADKVSVRRAGFALKLRDIEAYSRALPPEAWKAQRHAFLTSFTRHVLVLPSFFDFFNYLQRILLLTVNCADFTHLRQMLDALDSLLKQLANCDCIVKASSSKNGSNEILCCFKSHLKTVIREAVEAAFPLRMSKNSKRLWKEHFFDSHPLYEPRTRAEIMAQHRSYLKRDLAFRPLKQYLLPPSLSGVTRHPISRKELSNTNLARISSLLQDCIVDGSKILGGLSKIPTSAKFPSGLLFPVRPFGIHDLYLIHRDPFSPEGSQDIASILLSMRGFEPEKGLPVKSRKSKDPIEISNSRPIGKAIRIAVTSWKTSNNSWIASVSGDPDPDKSRFDRLNRLLNAVLRCIKPPDYIMMPELSIPAHWFLAVAGKLQGKGISLICGIQYIHAPRKTVYNQVWAALSHDALGFPTIMVYRQDKQIPALHEERQLMRVAGKSLRAQLRPWTEPPVISHGEFQFALLICSELTNIAYRTFLRGNVDALFVPEWNQDTETFHSLVESAALDIHAYIIQCNDRQYGDSRIRAPYKDSWKRDIVRVKGGIEDYFVTGEIDVETLRAFQSSYRSPDKPFKPVPNGFKISHRRKILPKGDDV